MTEYFLDGKLFQCGSIEPGLYVVSTPIGNLSDISIRALKTLAGVDKIACEDTRTTGKLLKHFGIKTRMLAYHEHNAAKTGPQLLDSLQKGESIALVSDAGTPLISDPGFKLVTTARQHHIRVIPIPGASAPLAALVASGMQTDSFMFAGFLPTKTTARKNRLRELADLTCSLIFFESPNRLASSLADMISVFGGDCQGAIGRELTKLHEEISSGSLSQLAQIYQDRKIRGEIVVLLNPEKVEPGIDADALLRELMSTMTLSRAASEASRLTGKTKRDCYQRALLLQSDRDG